jgi:hypothetical protein
MRGRTAGWIVLSLGAALLLATVALGQLLMPELHGPDPPPLSPHGGSVAMIKLSIFGASFPLGLGLSLTGAALLGGASRGRGLLLGLLALGGVALTRLVPRLFGTESSALYFGTGGLLILILFLAVAWTWSRHRLTLPAEARGAADLQGLGYLCFGIAAWFSCGTGGVPGYALSPGRMASAGSLWFAVSNFKVVMAFFVLGWALTLAGLRRAVSAARRQPGAG